MLAGNPTRDGPEAFRVLIIEARSADDISHDVSEGLLLQQQLRIVGVPSAYVPVEDQAALMKCLGQSAREFDVIHFSGHGCKEGFGFLRGKLLPWKDLATALLLHASGRLVAVSSCHSAKLNIADPAVGLTAFAKAVGIAGPTPPTAVLTMVGLVNLGDATLTWGLFYRHLAKRLKSSAALANCSARDIHDTLKLVKAGDLHKVCAFYWYAKYEKYGSISPWALTTEDEQATFARGEPVDPSRALAFG